MKKKTPVNEIKYVFMKKRGGCEEGQIFIAEQSSCEHCTDLEPFDACISDGSTFWCINCYTCENEIPDDVLKEIEKREKVAKQKFYKKKLKGLK